MFNPQNLIGPSNNSPVLSENIKLYVCWLKISDTLRNKVMKKTIILVTTFDRVNLSIVNSLMPLPSMLRSLRPVLRLKLHSKRLCYTGAFGSAIYAAYLYGNASPSKPTITHTLFSQFTAKCAWNQTAGFELQETLSSFIKYLQDINNQKQLSSSMVQEIWDELSTNLPLATEHDLSSLLSQDEINEVIDDPCLFQIMADRRKEITNLKQEANKLLKDVLNKIETDNDEHESLKNQMFHYSPMFHRKRIQKPIRCLVIDGGGLRGCLSITILKQLEKKAREQIGNTNIKI
eukprot:471885_1